MNYLRIPGNATLGVDEFCVMKFEAKNVGGNAVSLATGTPWVNINASSSKTACENITESGFNGPFTLMSNPEGLTIARNIENQAVNWLTDGGSGLPQLNSGHSDNNPNNALAVTDISDPYNGTGNNAGQTLGNGLEQKRTHTLSTSEEIWDFAGNVDERVNWDTSTDNGFTTGPTDAARFLKTFESTSLTEDVRVNSTGNAGSDGIADGRSLMESNLFPEGTHSNQVATEGYRGLGRWFGGSGGAASRGGYYNSPTTNAGVFAVLLFYPPSNSDSATGFRCVYRP